MVLKIEIVWQMK